jgi:hypothetical protein
VRVRVTIVVLVALFAHPGLFEVAVWCKFERYLVYWPNITQVTNTTGAHGSEPHKSEYTKPKPRPCRHNGGEEIADVQPITAWHSSISFFNPASAYISTHVPTACKTRLSNRNAIVRERARDRADTNSYKRGYRNGYPIEENEISSPCISERVLATRAHAFPSRIWVGTIDGTTEDERPTKLE